MIQTMRRTQPVERKYAKADFSSVTDTGQFEGYASIFGTEDLGHDIVERGAFARSLAKRPASSIKLLFQHDPSQPIGVLHEIREDHHGLFVKGQLLDDVARAREVRALMQAGALNGLSIGFQTVRATRSHKHGPRRLKEVDLWEISVVTFPMHPDARVSAFKNAATSGLPTTREIERLLTRHAGLTRSQARTLIASGLKSVVAKQDAADISPAAIAHRLRALTTSLSSRPGRPRLGAT